MTPAARKLAGELCAWVFAILLTDQIPLSDIPDFDGIDS